jgi:hypothetical protein
LSGDHDALLHAAALLHGCHSMQQQHAAQLRSMHRPRGGGGLTRCDRCCGAARPVRRYAAAWLQLLLLLRCASWPPPSALLRGPIQRG